MVYYGISYNTTDLSGDPYLNFSLSAFVELLAVILGHVTLERYGRKWPYCIAMFLSGFSLLLIMFVPARKLTLFSNF
jgi:MFS transporter, OCT family, solute carrier family 22 (organic cation transporter), member 4/5